MTGFGRGEGAGPDGAHLSVEIQAVNHKFLDLEIRFPEGWGMLEEPVRATVAQAIRRGKVRVTGLVKRSESRRRTHFHPEAARRYVTQLKQLRRRSGAEGPVTLGMVLGLPGVVEAQRESVQPLAWETLDPLVRRALDQMVRMRRREGRRLSRILLKQIEVYAGAYRKVRRQVPKIQQAARQRAVRKIRGMLGSGGRKEAVAEAAQWLQGNEVSEELDRIQSHLTALKEAARGRIDNPGRSIDFLAQELHRETNTLGAKLRDGAVVKSLVAMKNQIEKIREQAANVE